jgi:hypothetical protein
VRHNEHLNSKTFKKCIRCFELAVPRVSVSRGAAGSLVRGKKPGTAGKPGLIARTVLGTANKEAKFILEILPGGRKVFIKKGGPFDPNVKRRQKPGAISRGNPVLPRQGVSSRRGSR